MARLFDTDPLTGSKEFFHYEEGTDTAFIESVADVSPVLEEAEGVRQQDSGTWGGNSFGYRVATIPLNIWAELERAGIAHDDALLKRWMNDNGYAKFRTKLGRV